MPLDQLPDELLLQVALRLPDSATPKHLKNLSLTSRKLRPIAQEALHTTARLAISCGCHPKVNAVVKLLRTLLDRPDLASKVKTLRFRAVRKRVERLYAESGFELIAFRDRCISKLEELGYRSNHAWWRSINNCIESAFGGLLLALLPNLIDLDFWIKDHQRGPPSSECITGMWGSTAPPEAIIHGWKNIRHLVTGDTSMLKCDIEFDKLATLDLRTVSIGTVLRLNGPGSLQGAENVTDLALTVSVQFADRPLVEKAEIEFSDLLDALACRALKSLKLQFINDGYHIGDDLSTELNTGYFLEQLGSVQMTLETLSITLETTEDDGELDWLIDMCQHPAKSLKHFIALKSLTIPQSFIFDGRTSSWNVEDNCQPNELPPKLEQLELLFPHEFVEEWAQGFLSENFYTTSSPAPAWEFVAGKRTLKKLTLTCREDVGNGIGVSYFTDEVNEIWWTLSTEYGIEAEVHDQQRDTKENLAGLYENQSFNVEDSDTGDEDVDEEDWEDGEEDARPSIEPSPSTSDKPVPGLSDQTIILAFLRSIAKHSFGRTAEQVGMALNWRVKRVDKAVEDLSNDGNVDLRPEGALLPTIHFVSASEELLEHDRAYGPRAHSAHAERLTDWPRHPRPDDVAQHRIALLRCLRDLPQPGTKNGLTESELNDELKLDVKLMQDAMFQLLDAGFIEPRRNSDGAQTVAFKRESDELKKEDLDNGGGYTSEFSSVALTDQTRILNFLRLLHHTGRTPEGTPAEQISEAMDIPFCRVTQAVARLLQDGNIRLSNPSLRPQRYSFVRESEEMLRQDSLKEELLRESDGWETDDSMPELEEY
ncbi:hypothetical protein E8E12_004601 [Didymella heteroderae]|uniref:F-box domain-containing protein n=1 Tax=Didymella heteroderae TaxID=1769908 RepID=A0A9P4WJZ2_9PLEO|nr:hypothetical protein E8E12_004601 [Didymella heteroderae]